MKTKTPKDRNIVKGDFVKKTTLKMKVYSNEAPEIKTDAKLSVKEKGNKEKLEKREKKGKDLKSGKVKNK